MHYREAAANLLTIPALDPYEKILSFKVSAVRIEKSIGLAKPVGDFGPAILQGHYHDAMFSSGGLMSFIAGVVSLSGSPVTDGYKLALLAALPAAQLDPYLYTSPQALLIQMDLGAHGERGFFEDEVGVALLAGHPLIPFASIADTPDGCRGAAALHHASEAARRTLAVASNGNWAGALYRARGAELTLLGDRLAVRPLYWWYGEGVVVFASTISFLEKLPFVALDVDLLGLIEQMSLGFALADRTPWRGVHRILPGEIVRFGDKGIQRTRYWNWADLEESTDLESLPQATLDFLRMAVERRRAGRQRAITTLSGGLDSRVINLLLHDAGVNIHSFNFSPHGSQDAEFGRLFAEAIGTTHHPAPRTDWSILDLLAVASRGVREGPGGEADHSPVWVGAGGSTSVGWAHITPSMIRALRSGDTRSAVREYLGADAASFSEIDLRPHARSWIAGRVESAIITEIQRYPATMDPVRRFFLFLVENQERRTFDAPLENIMGHRQEVWAPFYDGSFLTKALSVPADAGFGHGFYDRWFRMLPPVARSVPWQTYPGHLPCPLPIPAELNYQWSGVPHNHESRGVILSAWTDLLLGRRFPGPVFRRSILAVRAGLHVLGVRDESSSLKIASTLKRYWMCAQHPTTPW
jgi:hypothetical protein